MTPLGTRPGLGTESCYETPCDLQIKHRQNIVINIKSVAVSPIMAQSWRLGRQTSKAAVDTQHLNVEVAE